jgi:peptidoglycan/xylan/chitin deacetylase (PgdA/CDA1 family)
MAKKYFSWRFDDGLEQDKNITAILRKYRMGATFNLNSGLFGVRKYIGRISNLGFSQ